MRYLVVLVMLVCLVSPAMSQPAEEGGLVSQILDKAKPAMLYDFRESRLLGGIIASVVDYKDLLSLDIGGITDFNNNGLLVGISADVKHWAEKGGLEFNLPERISIGSFYARDFQEKTWMVGVSLSYQLDW